MESRQRWGWAGDPLQLPRVSGDELSTVTGDRRPGAKFCAGCGAGIEEAVVTRGFWSYCSIECAVRTEHRDDPNRRPRWPAG